QILDGGDQQDRGMRISWPPDSPNVCAFEFDHRTDVSNSACPDKRACLHDTQMAITSPRLSISAWFAVSLALFRHVPEENPPISPCRQRFAIRAEAGGLGESLRRDQSLPQCAGYCIDQVDLRL